MGRVKEWAMSEQHCIVCDQEFIPAACLHEVDLSAPTCSRQCYNEYHHIMNAIADMQEQSLGLPDNVCPYPRRA